MPELIFHAGGEMEIGTARAKVVHEDPHFLVASEGGVRSRGDRHWVVPFSAGAVADDEVRALLGRLPVAKFAERHAVCSGAPPAGIVKDLSALLERRPGVARAMRAGTRSGLVIGHCPDGRYRIEAPEARASWLESLGARAEPGVAGAWWIDAHRADRLLAELDARERRLPPARERRGSMLLRHVAGVRVTPTEAGFRISVGRDRGRAARLGALFGARPTGESGEFALQSLNAKELSRWLDRESVLGQKIGVDVKVVAEAPAAAGGRSTDARHAAAIGSAPRVDALIMFGGASHVVVGLGRTFTSTESFARRHGVPAGVEICYVYHRPVAGTRVQASSKATASGVA